MIPIGDDDTSRRTTPVVTYALIALNILFFFVELSGGDAFVVKWALVPSRFLEIPSVTPRRSLRRCSMHAGVIHLAATWLYLWIFGDNVEDRFGHLTFHESSTSSVDWRRRSHKLRSAPGHRCRTWEPREPLRECSALHSVFRRKGQRCCRVSR